MVSADMTPAAPPHVSVAACPACNATARRFELRARDAVSLHAFDLVRCQKCGLVYVDPRPDDGALSFYYTDYYGERHPIFKNLFMAARVRKLGHPPHGARLLDIGCGRGDFLLAARRRGWEVVGIEQAHSPIMAMREGLGLTVITPEEASALPASSFDAVTLWHVLEHVPDPREQLAQVRRLLRPEGRLLVELPNFGGWHARVGRAAWYHVDVPRHLLHFDRRSLTSLLTSSGFEPVRWETLSVEYDIFGSLQGMLNRICRQPNHLFQLLSGQRSAGGRADTALSFALLPVVGILATVLTIAAALARKGGVLRVISRKRSET